MQDALPRSLQPTRCHEYPPIFRFPSMVLAHFRSPLHPPPRHARACVRRTRRAPHRRRVLRCRMAWPQAVLRLGAADTSYDSCRPPRGDRPRMVCGDPRALVWQHASRTTGPMTLPVMPRLAMHPKSAPSVTTPRTPPLPVRQHRTAGGPKRLPPMDPPSARQPFGRLLLGSRHCCPGLAARCAASNSRSRARSAR